MSQLFKVLCLLMVVGMAWTASAQAQDNVFWTNGVGDHDFANVGNWSGGYPAGDFAIIQNNGYANVTSSLSDVYRIHVGADLGGAGGSDPMGTGILNIEAGGSLTATSSCYTGHGNGNEGTINLNAGSLSTGSLVLGYGDNSKGTFNANGGTYSSSGFLYVGFASGSQGILNLTSGSVTGSRELRAGYRSGSQGIINISGGSMTIIEDAYLGYYDNSVGILNLSGGSISVDSANRELWLGKGADSVGVVHQTNGTLISSSDAIRLAYEGVGSYAYYDLVDGIATGKS